MNAQTPLIDLHRHLEGSIRVSTILELADRYGDPLAADVYARSQLVHGGEAPTLRGYLTKVDRAFPVLQTLGDWERVAREAVEDAFNDGLEHVEFRFAPWVAQLQFGLDAHDVIDAVASGVAAARRLLPITVSLLGVIVRDLGPEAAVLQVKTFTESRKQLAGIDLAGNENGFPAREYQPAFDLARAAGLRLTAHAGEGAGPASIWEAVRELGVERIGHGVRSIEDPALLEELAQRNITLDLALTSNVQTGAVASYAEHPLPGLIAAGVPVTINTDDPRASNVTLSHEHHVALHAVGITSSQLATLAVHARTSAF